MTHTTRRASGPDGRAVLLAAGLADLAVSAVGSVAGTLGTLLRRSDAVDLARDAERDLEARGRLALDRYAHVPPAYLEVLARHVVERRAAADGRTADGRTTHRRAPDGDV
ncbi:polyprenyl synthetase [Streptomyces sp. NPDC093546]|uniref:polyprenyl synthetase n=1 Tax=Streptomyces sp. NPDC093546 TaxID=3366040 RepID=UPI00380633F6